jgi:hypothetical protein
MAMATDARAWLEQELRAALGFSEVSDIAAYVVSSFSSQDAAAAYLVELLGIPAAKAAAIGARLFPAAPPAAAAAAPSAPKRQQKQKKDRAPAAAAAAPLVARPAEVNSRLKPAKNLHVGGGAKAAGGARSAHVTNCLRCGRVEHNSGRKCAFCEAPLRYEALPDGYDAGLGGFSAPAAAREAVEEATEQLEPPVGRMWRNPDLSKDAQEVVERAARVLARDAKKPARTRAGDAAAAEGPALAPRGRVQRDGEAYSVVVV